MTKSNLGKRIYLAHTSNYESITIGSQDRNLRQELNEADTHRRLFTVLYPVGWFSYTAQDLLAMADTAYSTVSPFTSISHQENAPQISHTQANLI